METYTKEWILRALLSFVERFVPLQVAMIATLGGKGVEAKVWSGAGVPAGNGWLIEHHRGRNTALIKNCPYHVHDKLHTFGEVLRSTGADEALDCFHLDIEGSITPQVHAEVAPLLPFVAASPGRCLAVTVADARWNVSTVDWMLLITRAELLFGDASERLFQRLLAEQKKLPSRESERPAFLRAKNVQPFDPEKAAQREFATLVAIMELIVETLPGVTIGEMQRFVYVSSYRSSFRMRSYFLRLAPAALTRVATQFVAAWTTSPLAFLDKSGLVTIGSTTPPTSVGITEIAMKQTEVGPSRLREIAQALGGAEFAEYQRLALAEARLAQIVQAVQGASDIVPALPAAPANDAPKARGRARTKKRGWDDLTPKEQIEWLIKVLERKANEGGPIKNGHWKALLKADFGHYSEALGKSLRSALARTNGKFRANFENRIRKAFGDEAQEYLDRLTAITVS